MSIQTNTRLSILREYIYTVPETVGFQDFSRKYNSAKIINNIISHFPSGKHKKDIITNIQDMLPRKLDSELQNLKESCFYVREPWKSHIISEIDLILSELETFRDSHLEEPEEVDALLHQLNYMSKDQ
jgi:hypothetical protein